MRPEKGRDAALRPDCSYFGFGSLSSYRIETNTENTIQQPLELLGITQFVVPIPGIKIGGIGVTSAATSDPVVSTTQSSAREYDPGSTSRLPVA